MTIELFLTGILQGLNLAIIAYAVMIPFRLLNFPDLSTEGSYPVGGALCGSLLSASINPALAFLIAILGGGLIGIATSLIHLKLKVNSLLAGIIISTMAYSVNLRVMGKPNIALFDSFSVFNSEQIIPNIFLMLGIVIFFCIPFILFLYTDFGLKLRATGINPSFIKKQNTNINYFIIFGLFLSGCLGGLAGSLIIQMQSYMDISMGVGIVIHALAALMIGESICNNNSLLKQMIAPLIGALFYQQIQGLALAVGLAPSDLKFFTGAIILLVIAINRKVSRTS